MKTKFLIIFASLLALLLSGCTPSDLVGYDHSGGSIVFFQLADSSLVNKVLIEFEGRDETVPEDYYYSWREDRCIALYPKNTAGTPLFGKKKEGTNFRHDWIVGEKYSLEDLINTPKFIALKDGYYTCWPFVQLEKGCFINVDWKDLLTMDIDTVKVYMTDPFIKRYYIHEKELVKLTHKSTKHFHGLKTTEITIDDVVSVLNNLIETGTIEDYCYESHRYFDSWSKITEPDTINGDYH